MIWIEGREGEREGGGVGGKGGGTGQHVATE